MSSMGKSNVTIQVKDLQMKISATAVKGKLTLPLPAIKLERPFGLPKVKLADPNFNQVAERDMIIGAQLYEYESLRKGKTTKHRGLHSVCTAFGYVIFGVVKQCKTIQSVPIVHYVEQDDTLRRLWEIEEFSPPKEKFQLYEEAEATKHYDSTTKIDDEGRFVVEIPSVKPTPILGESYEHALTRFGAQERCLQNNANLRDQYKRFHQRIQVIGIPLENAGLGDQRCLPELLLSTTSCGAKRVNHNYEAVSCP